MREFFDHDVLDLRVDGSYENRSSLIVHG